MGVLRAMSHKAMGEFRAMNHNAPQSYRETPDSYDPHPNIENVCQGMTPLHMACSTGLADCVKVLHSYRARFDVNDWTVPARGPYQFAKHSQGDRQHLAKWLLENVRYMDTDTEGKGRKPEDKTRGSWSYNYRWTTGPKKGQGQGSQPQSNFGAYVKNT